MYQDMYKRRRKELLKDKSINPKNKEIIEKFLVFEEYKLKRKEGDRSKILLNEVDVMILKIITKKNEVAIMWLRDYLKISAISLRTHINRMVELNLITRNKIPKTNRSVLNLTKDGKDVLRIFEKAI